MIPQIIWFTLLLISLLLEANLHGKQRTGKHNIFTHIIFTGLGALLLYFGGFFDIIINKF